MLVFKLNKPSNVNESVGSSFKNKKGSVIGRSKFGVGKMMGHRIYVHKNYASTVIPSDILEKAKELLPKDFQYNCVSYDFTKKNQVRFDEAPDFDSAREPIPGKMITVDLDSNTCKASKSNQIWHHKWEWVSNDYKAFNVQKSYEWSKEWTSKLDDISGIGSKKVWDEKLKAVGLEVE